jgi:hypothetical protein
VLVAGTGWATSMVQPPHTDQVVSRGNISRGYLGPVYFESRLRH